MLSELYIENLAVIEKTSISFAPGFNVFTGETGAGKSIVIDAINAVLGQRTSKEIVRHGTEKASVSARFTNLSPHVIQLLGQYGFSPENGEMIISRDIFADQKSTAHINGKPVNIGTLREIGVELVNIHGQHDNQILLSPEKHIDILDKYGNYEELLAKYHTCYQEVLSTKKELRQASLSEQDKAGKFELLSYQVKEIREANLVAGEDAELEKRRKELRNAEKLLSYFDEAHAALFGNEEGGAIELVHLATQDMESASDDCEDAGDIYSRLDSLSAELVSTADSIADMRDRFRFSPEELESIEERLNEIEQLKHKYGDSIEKINAFAQQAQQELDSLEISNQRIRKLNQKATTEYQRLLQLSEQLSKEREKAAQHFVDTVITELRFLDMPNVRLEVHREETKPGAKGRDAVEFLISTNVGEPPKPIAKIASGGELSRIMLAIKNTLADKDDIPTLIFDEIDTGVSGRAAQKIGLKLKQAAKYRQVLSVTHLAQIAALADCHFLIQKDNDQKRTFTKVQKLSREERIKEVARIMGTDQVTDLMLQNAEEMIRQGEVNQS